MSLCFDDSCFYRNCPRHQSLRATRPGWLDDDEQDRLRQWSKTDQHIEGDVLASLFALEAQVDRHDRWEREAMTIRRVTLTLPPMPWADDEHQQAAVRYWLSRLADVERRVRVVSVGAAHRGSRFSDPLTAFAEMVDKVRWSGDDAFTARCPAHEDKSSSLSVTRGSSDNRLLVHCHAGCSTVEVLGVVAWTLADLFSAA